MGKFPLEIKTTLGFRHPRTIHVKCTIVTRKSLFYTQSHNNSHTRLTIILQDKYIIYFKNVNRARKIPKTELLHTTAHFEFQI